MGEVILTMKEIDKSFPGVHALDHVNLEIRKGEVHALMGENGAGKSTLMKVLTGIYSKDSGTITYEGKEVEFSNPRDAQDAGIVIVHQELNMMNHLTVAQNIFIGREMMSGKLINDAKMNKEAKKLFDKLNIDIDPTEKMGNLTVGKQQMCEIAKAISHEAKVIIFDEPSAALTESEIEELFKIIRDLRDQGLGIVYISHRMDEIKVITDRVTVMRDGGYVGTLITKDSTKDDIIKMMVGRVIYEDPKTESNVPKNAPVVLKVEHLNAGNMVRDVSFELHKGEILGFSGLMGAGRTEIFECIMGLRPEHTGVVKLRGKELAIENVAGQIDQGFALVPEDRQRDGLVQTMNIERNLSLSSLKNYAKGIFLKLKSEEDAVEGEIKDIHIKVADKHLPILSLSGGNQQKVVIGKGLLTHPEILLMDEPSRGIDIGAKTDVFEIINSYADKGLSIIVISSELEEITAIADRVIVLSNGKKTAELAKDEITQDRLVKASYEGHTTKK